MELTLEQQQVIEHKEGHAIVSAVAGSGKTQTMVLRIKHLIDQYVDPKDILVVMYNKSAQLDFVRRLSEVIGNKASLVQVKTFHSLGFALSKLFIKLSFMPDFKLVTQSWQLRKLIQKSLDELKAKNKLLDDIDSELIDQYDNYLTLIKSDIEIDPSDINIGEEFNIKLTKSEQIRLSEFFRLYEKNRISEKIRTFDDLIYEPMQLIAQKQELIDAVPWSYPYIIVDEYQDINAVQQALIKLFVKDNSQVMVVGDIDQTIYEWRGSKPYYMLKGFKNEFGSVVHYQLSNTFRYGHRLSLAANYIITRNTQRLKNLCISHKVTPPTDIEIISNRQIDQLPLLIDQLLKAKPQYGFGDVAILVRKYSSAALFELACLKHQLPYQILGNEGVTQREVSLSLIGYLGLFDQAKFFENLNIEQRKLYLRAMLLCPSLYLRQNMLETVINQIAKTPQQGAQILLRLSANYSLKPFQAERIRTRSYLYQELVAMSNPVAADQVLTHIIETLEYDYYFKSKQYGVSEAYDNGCLCEAIVQYAKMTGLLVDQFLEHFHQLKTKAISEESHHHGVSILSIHRAKGLEWSNVILLDATERAFFGAGEHYLSEESERRLFYVAITRAKEKLLIVGGNDQMNLSQWYQSKRQGFPFDIKPNHSVRFLYEMNYDSVCDHLNRINELLKSKVNKKITGFSLTGGKLFKDYISSLKNEA